MMIPRMLAVATAAALIVAGAGSAIAQAPAAPAPPTQPAPAAPAPTPPSVPPPDVLGDIALSRAAIQVQRQALVTMAMDLAPREAEAFWPLYREYRVEMAKVGDRLVKLTLTYTEQYDSLSDEQAGRLLDEYLQIERMRHQVKAKYVPRFRKAMPARKVARFFQVDNKLDAVINAELAEHIPLVR